MRFSTSLALLLLSLVAFQPAHAAKPTDGAAALLRSCGVAHRDALTRDTPEEVDLAALRATHAAEIDSASTFKPIGLTPAQAETYLGTAPGQELLADLAAADSASPPATIRARAVDQLGTGSEDPKLAKHDPVLVKIVPHGQSVSPYSPYFATVAAMKAACDSPLHLADSFAVPLKSEAATYDLYEIKPAKGQADSFVSIVAPTSELAGLALRPGGAVQSLVPNRGEWTKPVLVGTVGR
jgi:hypothetical protein